MPRFVVLEHRWNGVHWDFMLEEPESSTLRTWAIDAPIVPGAVLPARALGDHRLVYLDYEGEVSGGRGVVRQVDRGTYVIDTWTPSLVRVRIEGAQLVGEVELREAVSTSGTGDLRWTFRLGNFD
jgi:hypothetical protein